MRPDYVVGAFSQQRQVYGLSCAFPFDERREALRVLGHSTGDITGGYEVSEHYANTCSGLCANNPDAILEHFPFP